MDQQALKRQLIISAITRALAAGNTPEGVRHVLRSGRVVHLHYRLFAYIMDLEEQWLVCGTRHFHNNRDLSHEVASNLEPKHKSSLKKDNGKPFLRCARSDCRGSERIPLRTPNEHLKLQLKIFQMRQRIHAKADATELEEKKGVYADVEQQLHRLHHLIRWETRGIYGALAFDYLHTFGLGIYTKFISVLDAVFLRFHSKTDTIKTKEDVRDLWDRRLAAVPPFFDGDRRLLKWMHWWAENKGTISGDDYEAVVMQLFFVYANCEVFIAQEHHSVRATVVATHKRMLRVMRELRMPAWRTAADFDRLDDEIVRLADDLRAVQAILEEPWPASKADDEKTNGNCPGDGFDIPKIVEMLHAARDIQRRGFPASFSAASKECVGVKQLKEAIRRTTRHRREDFDEDLYNKSSALDETRRLDGADDADDTDDDGDVCDVASLAAVHDPSKWPIVISFSRTCGPIRNRSATWSNILDHLVAGTSGPPIRRMAADDIAPKARSALNTPRRALSAPSDIPQVFLNMRIALDNTHKLTLRSSVCVELWDGTFAQVVGVLGPRDSASILALPFESVMPGGGRHPVFDMPWLKRLETPRIFGYKQVRERAHIVKVFGTLHRPPQGAAIVGGTFVVDRGIWWRNTGDPRILREGQPAVFRLCPSCNTRVPQPVQRDAAVKCSDCGTSVHW